jgi:dTDP-4-amino-4,6-dideoxygalactose transaminase
LKLPILDLKRQYQGIAGPIQEAVREVLESGHFILGPRGAALEQALAGLVGVPWGVGVASGTDALVLALQALSIGPGDEVVTTPYTFFATAGAVARVGARPIFVDVREDFLMDPAKVPAALGPRTRAFLPVHLFGRAMDLSTLGPMLQARGIPVVEDAAQAIGATTASGAQAGSMGDLATLSFYPTKNLGACGDAGMVLGRRPEHAERVRMLRARGSRDRYHHVEVGWNSRLDEIQAAVLLAKLPHLSAWNEGRRRVALWYRDALDGGKVTLPDIPPLQDGRHVFHQFVVCHPERDRLRDALAAAGVGTSVFYPVPLHLQECFRGLGHGPGDFPVAERLARESLALPIFPEMTEAEVALVARAIDAF